MGESLHGAVAPTTFTQWLRPKRRVYDFVLALSLLASLPMPIAMQWLSSAMGPDAGWEHVETFVFLRANYHLPWWLTAWLFPLAFTGSVAAALALFEGLVFGLRLDRGDHAWSSIAWSLRGWVLALAWWLLAMVAIVSVAVLAPLLENALGPASLAIAELPFCLMLFAGMLVGWNPSWLAAARPSLGLTVRWPGRQALWFLLALFAGLLLCIAFATPPLARSGLGVLLLPVTFFALIALQLVWLGARPSPQATFTQVAGQALRPRVFLPRLVMRLRWYAIGGIAVLPVLPFAWFMIFVLPMLEPQLTAHCCRMDAIMPFIHASRWTIAWWWAIAMLAIMAFYVMVMPFAWLDTISSGRLLVELGLVPGVQARKD